MKLWEKNFKLNKLIEDFTVGNDYILDQKLVRYDCLASIAHAKMLGRIGILKRGDVQRLVKGLNRIIRLDKEGKFKISKKQEDCHTAVENYLTKKLGDVGKKIHTARSRNDQALTALRLYYREELTGCREEITDLIERINKFVKKNKGVKFPGYTHTRKAMPTSVAMWGNALVDSMRDNQKMIDDCLELINQSPLGTGAGYGVPLKIDRNYTAKLLGFRKIQKNPIYVQNSRGKFESTILHVLSQVMYDLNKAATDLIIFTLPELGYFDLPEEFCTGSSIMPQKKNPDVLEILRAKYHVVVSYEFQVKGVISNLMTGYNRDLQLTKEPVMRGFDISRQSLQVMTLVFSGLRINKEKCRKALTEEVFATKEVYELVKKGVPFREAYRKVAGKY